MDQQFNPDQNPFTEILSQLGQGGQQPQGMPQAPQTPIQPGQEGMGEDQMMQDQLQPGVNPSSTKFLSQAINALQQFITQADDRDSILIGRNIVQLLAKLIEKEEGKQSEQLGAGGPAMGQPEAAPAMPGGMPGMGPEMMGQ